MAHHPHTPELHEVPDSWHRHTAAEGRPQHEHASKVNTAILWVAFSATVLFILFTIIITYIYFTTFMTAERARKIETTVLAEESQRYRADADAALGAYGWADPVAQRIALPIDIAKQRILERYDTQSPQPR